MPRFGSCAGTAGWTNCRVCVPEESSREAGICAKLEAGTAWVVVEEGEARLRSDMIG